MKTGAKVLFIFLILISCSEPEKFPGFSKTSSGIFYKLHLFGEGKYYPKQNDIVSVNCILKNSTGENMNITELNGYITFQLKNDTVIGDGLIDAVGLLNEGDSATFLIPANQIIKNSFNQNDSADELITLELKIEKVYSAREYAAKAKEFENWSKKKDDYEHRILTDYIKKNKITEQPYPEGFFILPIKEGKGKPASFGHAVLIHYIGTYLDGTEFDNTYKSREPLDFILGQSDQVIKGIELGLCQMKRGGKAKFILPSHLAFGDKGSSNGKIPPNTTVIFEVELVLLN